MILADQVSPMIEPWLPRPRAPRGDLSPDMIFCCVGRALSSWEAIEGEISVAYIGLIRSPEKYRANEYFKTASFAARHALVKKAITANVNGKDCSGFEEFVDAVLKYSPRRHEIAHGRVFNCGEHGFYLAPNNTLSRNYPSSAAAYQYTSSDIKFYCDQFESLAATAMLFSERLAHKRAP
jgi:hypothetical protein